MVSVNPNVANNITYVNNSQNTVPVQPVVPQQTTVPAQPVVPQQPAVTQQPAAPQQTAKPVLSPADKYIEKMKKQNLIEAEGEWGQRKTNICISSIMPFVLSLCYSMGAAILKNVSSKHVLGAMAIGALASIGSHIYVNSDKNKQHYYKKFEDTFNKMNTNTDATISDKTFYVDFDLGAKYNPISGKIQAEKDYIKDPLYTPFMKKHIKRQLVHAGQYETVARSKDGIKKINYAVVNGYAKKIGKSAKQKAKFNEVYQDIINNPAKYQNTKINLAANGAEVSFPNYVSAVNTLLNNPNVGINDIPVIIDEQHYQNVINKKGALTPEEEAKADEYYKAMLDYKSPSSPFDVYSPYSSYRKNLLVKEAYEAK